MNPEAQITAYLEGQSASKSADMRTLHQHIGHLLPEGRLWFLDGKDDTGKVVTNPSIGYGQRTIHYKDGSTKEFYQIGISGNTSGISVYIMGLEDRKYLPQRFGTTIGKADVTGYCIRFKTLKDINMDVLTEAIQYGIEQTREP